MKTARSMGWLIGGLTVALLVTGCGPDPKDLQIEALQQQIMDHERENASLRSRLARAVSDRDAAIARANALQQQLRELRAELARKPQQIEVPVMPRGWQAGPEGTAWVDLGNNILFKEGYADLQPAGKAALQNVVNDINTAFSDKLIVVIGHTDDIPIQTKKHLYKDNLDLSVTRGSTVFRELQRMGIQPQRMLAAGQGEFNPKVPNSSDANRQINRRVQILAVPRPDSIGATGASNYGGSATPSADTAAGGQRIRLEDLNLK